MKYIKELLQFLEKLKVQSYRKKYEHTSVRNSKKFKENINEEQSNFK